MKNLDNFFKTVIFPCRSSIRGFIHNLKELFLGLVGIAGVLLTILFAGLVIYAIVYIISGVGR